MLTRRVRIASLFAGCLLLFVDCGPKRAAERELGLYTAGQPVPETGYSTEGGVEG